MKQFFEYSERLGIQVPYLEKHWEDYDYHTQQQILFYWEKIRGHIPDRIKEIEKTINEKQARLEIEEDFEVTCRLNSEIAEHASIINDLWIWYRTDQEINTKVHQ